MSILLLLCRLSTEFLLLLDFINCAPKIGGIMFEPIIFEAFESDVPTIPTEKDATSSTSTEDTTLLVTIENFNKTATQVHTRTFDADIKFTEDTTIITTSTSTPEETTAFISELNIEIESTPKNRTLSFNHSSIDQNTTTEITPTTKKMMLYELVTPDKLKSYGRERDESATQNANLNFLGYNFDDTICRIVDDRVLCGYNTNPQQAQPVKTVEVGNGCRLRGDRIECGYVNPPFDGMRRPSVRPAGNRSLVDKLNEDTSEESHEFTSTHSTTEATTTTEPTTTTTKPTTSTTTKATTTNPSTTTVRPSTTTVTTTTTESSTVKRQEHCVDKGDRIVCYDFKK